MNGLLAGSRGVQIDVLDDLGSHRFAADLGAGAGAEIDRHHIARTLLIRRKHVERALDPGRRRSFEIEVAIDPVDRTAGAELGEPCINGFADPAEFRISRIA